MSESAKTYTKESIFQFLTPGSVKNIALRGLVLIVCLIFGDQLCAGGI